MEKNDWEKLVKIKLIDSYDQPKHINHQLNVKLSVLILFSPTCQLLQTYLRCLRIRIISHLIKN